VTAVVTERRCAKCDGSFAAMRDDALYCSLHADKRFIVVAGII
jgi:hypothetical protein